MTAKYLLTIMAAVILTMPMAATAGNIEPISGPDDNSTAMYTLEDIYNYLDTGVAGSKRPGGFTEPLAGPTTPTGRILDEVHDKITEKCITCEGTLNGTRWCDQGDGTVKDMTTGLVWLKNANCIGVKKWIDSSGDDAQTSSGTLKSGSCGLSDSSVVGDWRLPTKNELYGLANGTEPVRSGSMRAFTGVQRMYYWTSTTDEEMRQRVWLIEMTEQYNELTEIKNFNMVIFYVWPVRSDN